MSARPQVHQRRQGGALALILARRRVARTLSVVDACDLDVACRAWQIMCPLGSYQDQSGATCCKPCVFWSLVCCHARLGIGVVRVFLLRTFCYTPQGVRRWCRLHALCHCVLPACACVSCACDGDGAQVCWRHVLVPQPAGRGPRGLHVVHRVRSGHVPAAGTVGVGDEPPDCVLAVPCWQGRALVWHVGVHK